MPSDAAYSSFARILGNKSGKELMDTGTKTAKTVGMDVTKTKSKRVDRSNSRRDWK